MGLSQKGIGQDTGKNVAFCATISADSFAYSLKCCTKCYIPALQDNLGVEMLQEMQHFTSTGPFHIQILHEMQHFRELIYYLWGRPLFCVQRPSLPSQPTVKVQVIFR